MRALVLQERIGPDGLGMAEVDEPEDDANSVIVDVAYAGVTYPDLLIVHGRYQDTPELPFIPGLEVSGRVRSAPEGSGLAIGTRVAAACMAGGYAQVARAHPALVVPLPPRMSDEVGSGLMINYQTMHFALHRRGGITRGDTVLVLGAGGGIGIAAIQLASAAGALVIAVCRGSAKAALCVEAGADEVLDTESESSVVDEVMRLTGRRGVDIVVDPVGGEAFVAGVRCLAPEGRLLVVGFTAGIPTVAANRLLLRNATVMGVAWGAFLTVDPDIARSTGLELARLAADGMISPPVTSVWALHEGAAALNALESRQIVGKAALAV